LQQIMEFAQKKQKIKNEDIRDLLHISQSTATEYLTDLVNSGMLKVEGKGRATTYIY
jgi:Mn-dependent DtxR family transcriptional regulator